MSESLNVNNIISHVSTDAGTEMQNVADLSSSMDVTSPGDMAKMQLAMMKVNMSFQLESSMVKSVEDMLKAIVQRM
jgi:type III secretion apparatus needle protein